MTSSQSRLPLAIANLSAFVVVVIVNALATTIPLGGMTTGQLSDLYQNLFVPAGLTFSIWGIIYLLLGVYAVYGLVFSSGKSGPTNSFMEKVGILFVISCVANAGWIFSWQYRVLPLSLVCMVVLLVVLILIYNRLNVGRSSAAGSEKYMVHLPIEHLSRLDLDRHNRQRHSVACLLQMESLWDRGTGLGNRHDSRRNAAWTIIPVLSKGHLLYTGY